MNLRPATADDVESIREVARASLSASYGHAVDESLLTDAVEKWYAADDVDAAVTDPDTVFPVAVVDDEVVAFAESYVVDRRERVGEIDWIHVHPDHREGRVLADNEAGTAFYEREGYEPSGERVVEVGSERFDERRYRKRLGRDDVLREGIYETSDGETVYVDFSTGDRGSAAPFYAAYDDADHENRYGYFCGNCEGTNVAIDTMDAVECLDCRNRRRPSRWDAAY